MPRRAFAYSIALSQVGPVHDPEFVDAPKAVRDEVKRWVVIFGLKEKQADLAAGLDRRGVHLSPISPATAKYRESAMGPADPDAPPLMPARDVSRTRLLLKGEATRSGAQFFWDYDPKTGGSWGQILDYHRKGIGRSKVKRNVIGISEDALSRVRAQITERWRSWKRAGLSPNWRPDRAAPPPVPRLQTVGRTDYQNFTFGIGTDSAPRPGMQATGFFQRRPPAAPQRAARVNPRPNPPPPPPALPAAVQGLQFRPEKGLANHSTVILDVAKIEARFRQNRTFYVGPGGAGGIDDRYEQFGVFAAKAKAEGIPVEQPVLFSDRLGNVSFRNGRHRFAWLRDQGLRQLAVSVPRYLVKRFLEFFGID